LSSAAGVDNAAVIFPTAPPSSNLLGCAVRRQRHTGKQIAAETGVSPATVSRILRRLGSNQMRDLAPAEPVRRHERAASRWADQGKT